MPTEHIIELLITERDRIQSAIDALGGTAKRGGRPAGYKAQAHAVDMPNWVKPKQKQRKKRVFTAKQRADQRARMKAYWKAKKAAEKKA